MGSILESIAESEQRLKSFFKEDLKLSFYDLRDTYAQFQLKAVDGIPVKSLILLDFYNDRIYLPSDMRNDYRGKLDVFIMGELYPGEESCIGSHSIEFTNKQYEERTLHPLSIVDFVKEASRSYYMPINAVSGRMVKSNDSHFAFKNCMRHLGRAGLQMEQPNKSDYSLNMISVEDVLNTLRECNQNPQYTGMLEPMLTFASELTGLSEDTLLMEVSHDDKQSELAQIDLDYIVDFLRAESDSFSLSDQDLHDLENNKKLRLELQNAVYLYLEDEIADGNRQSFEVSPENVYLCAHVAKKAMDQYLWGPEFVNKAEYNMTLPLDQKISAASKQSQETITSNNNPHDKTEPQL